MVVLLYDSSGHTLIQLELPTWKSEQVTEKGEYLGHTWWGTPLKQQGHWHEGRHGHQNIMPPHFHNG